jgi:hypothetical protein
MSCLVMRPLWLVEKSSSLGVKIMIMIMIMIIIFKSGLMRLVEKSSSLAPGGDSANIVMSPYHDAAAARHPLDPKFNVCPILVELSGVNRRLHDSSARLVRLFRLHDL